MATEVINTDSEVNSVSEETKFSKSDINLINLIYPKKKCDQINCVWPECDFKAKTRQSLECHQLIHDMFRIKKCYVCHHKNCGKGFQQKSLLNRHLLTHSVEMIKSDFVGNKITKSKDITEGKRWKCVWTDCKRHQLKDKSDIGSVRCVCCQSGGQTVRQSSN